LNELLGRLLGKSVEVTKEKKGPKTKDEMDKTFQDMLNGEVPTRIIHKAPKYLEYVKELAKTLDNPDIMRQIVIENRELVFDDSDFLLYAKVQVEQNRKHGNEDGAKVWETVIDITIKTILIYD